MADDVVDDVVAAGDTAQAQKLGANLSWISRRWFLSGAIAVERDLARLCDLLDAGDDAQLLRRRLAQRAHLLNGLPTLACVANTLAVVTADLSANRRDLPSLADGLWLEPVALWGAAIDGATAESYVSAVAGGPTETWSAGSRVTSLAPLPRTAQIVSATANRRITICDVGTGSSDILLEHSASIRALHAFTISSVDWVSLGDQNGCVWAVRSPPPQATALTLAGRHDGAVRTLCSVATGPGRLIASGGEDGKVKVRSIHPGEGYTLSGQHSAAVNAICADQDDAGALLITASDDGTIRYWDPVAARREVEVVELGSSPLTSACTFWQRGALWVAAGSDDGTVTYWRRTSADHRFRLPRQGGSPVVSVTWLSDAPFPILALLTEAGLLELWSVSNAAMFARARLGEQGVTVVEPSRGAALAVACDATWVALDLDLDAYVLDLESTRD